MARIVFKYSGGEGYVVKIFEEKHNHPLVEPQYQHFMKMNRNIDVMHQKFILDCAKSIIGASRAHKLLTEFLGGYNVVGCSA